MASLDIEQIAETRSSEDDGGVVMGSPFTRMHIGETGIGLRTKNRTSDNTGTESSIIMDNNEMTITSPRVNIASNLEDIFLNGMFSFNPELMMGLPSTMVTPIPVLKITPMSAFKGLLNRARIIKQMFGL